MENFFSTWYGGAITVAAGPIALALWAMLAKRVNVSVRFYNWGLWLRKVGLAYDIPVIGGGAEETMKVRIFSFVSDALRSLARGISGKPREDYGPTVEEMPPPEIPPVELPPEGK